jgi:hypothetical protein
VTTMHALFKAKVECKMTENGRIIFFARFWFESDDRGILDAKPPSRSNSATAEGYRKSLPQLHIHRSAAQTRIVSALQFWPSPRKLSPKLRRIFILPDIAVRILYAQPATAVSPYGFRVLKEVPTFREVSHQESGLWRGVSGKSRRRPRTPRRISPR